MIADHIYIAEIIFAIENFISLLTLPVPIPDEEKKLSEIFIIKLLCDASKGFIKALKTFLLPFEASQRSVKIKI